VGARLEEVSIVAFASVLVFWLVRLAFFLADDTIDQVLLWIVARLLLASAVVSWRHGLAEQRRRDWLRLADKRQKSGFCLTPPARFVPIILHRSGRARRPRLDISR
jgi:hypothetical protein